MKVGNEEIKELNVSVSDDLNKLIIVAQISYDKAKELFANMGDDTIIETDNSTYVGFTKLKSINTYFESATEMEESHIELEYNGLSKMVDDLKSEIATLEESLLELGKMVYE